jgi:alpha-D-xyloside xylohydrolase
VKVNDGYWRIRDGFTVAYPSAAYDVVSEPGAITVHAPVKPAADRSATIANPVLTVRLSAPMEDVIGVSVVNFAGERVREPRPALNPDPDHLPVISIEDDAATVQSGRLGARVARGRPWELEFFADGRTLTRSGNHGLTSVTDPDGRHHVLERLGLDVGELVYGLGERFTALVKNGQSVDIWNDDGGTSSELAYKNVPFYLTNRGYGVFVNSFGRVGFEVASEVVSCVQFSCPGQRLEYFVIYGPTPKEILRRYCQLTGQPGLPPAWSFGTWLSTSFLTDWNADTVEELVDGMAERDLPLSVVHFDSFWMRPFHFCDFEWNPEVVPDPRGTLTSLRERGVRSCAWINPFVSQQSSAFAEAQEAGFLLRRPNGDVWQDNIWQAGRAWVDFTNPAARRWYQDKLRPLLDVGIDCFKTDFGETTPLDVQYFDGSDPELMHNQYSYAYNEAVVELLREHHGENGAVVFARAATIGAQRFPVHWGGDPEPTFVSMAESLRGALSLGLCGFGFWSGDIGGFEGTPDPAVFKRWLPFGFLNSHSRLHGSISYRVPWLFGDEAVAVMRRFSKLKLRLMPYLYAAAREAHRSGVPVLRAMVIEFPADPACWHLDQQYMFGPDLLVAPVFNAAGDVRYYVPAGDWHSYLTGEIVAGPGWRQERHDFLSLPLLVRPGAVIPVGPEGNSAEYDYRDGVTLECFDPQEGARQVRVPSPDSAEPDAVFDILRRGDRLTVSAAGSSSWQLLLVGQPDATVAGDGSVTPTARGALVRPADRASSVSVSVGSRPA